MERLLFVTLAVVLGVVVACEKAAVETQSAASEPLPADLFTTSEPAGAVEVVAARQSAKDGDAIVIKGRVAGQKEPLAISRAVMTIADASLKTCDQIPGDTCATPWDACCEPSSDVASKSVSVQVTGADGRPLKTGFAGTSGIAPLKQVVIAGTARRPPGGDALFIEAKQIYVVP